MQTKLSRELKKRRKSKGWSRKRMAEEIGVSASSLERWEKGHTPVHLGTRVNLVAYLGTSWSGHLTLAGFWNAMEKKEDHPRPLGDAIRQMRKEKGMTQGEMADLVGVTMRTMWAWETRGVTPQIEARARLSEMLAERYGQEEADRWIEPSPQPAPEQALSASCEPVRRPVRKRVDDEVRRMKDELEALKDGLCQLRDIYINGFSHGIREQIIVVTTSGKPPRFMERSLESLDFIVANTMNLQYVHPLNGGER